MRGDAADSQCDLGGERALSLVPLESDTGSAVTGVPCVRRWELHLALLVTLAYTACHSGLLLGLIQVIRHDPIAKRTVPIFVASVYTAAVQLGHFLDWLLALGGILCALTVWRRARVSSADVWVVLQGIGYSHVPLLLWVAGLLTLWLPLSIRLQNEGMSPVAMSKSAEWLRIAAWALLTRYLVNGVAIAFLAFFVGRTYRIGVKGSLFVVVLPLAVTSVVSHLIMWLLS